MLFLFCEGVFNFPTLSLKLLPLHIAPFPTKWVFEFLEEENLLWQIVSKFFQIGLNILESSANLQKKN